MSESNINDKTPTMLEIINKQMAKDQARAINKGLTRLKKISTPPKARAPVEADRTGRFIVVPVTTVLAETIDSAYAEAEKSCTESSIELAKAKKNKWFKWG